jgi:hypothetical protein
MHVLMLQHGVTGSMAQLRLQLAQPAGVVVPQPPRDLKAAERSAGLKIRCGHGG